MVKKVSFIFMLMFSCICANASIVINELMPKNVSFQVDDNHQFSAWAELYNNGAEEVNISEYFFSDNIMKPTQWQLNANDGVILKPGEFTIVYFDGLTPEEASELIDHGRYVNISMHADFKLPAKKGCLYLADEKGTIIDQMAYDTTYRNISYGRIVDGGDQLGYFLTPTPKAANATNSVATTKTLAPTFNLNSGFYQSEQKVKIYAADPKAKIFYTTDGSEPSVKSSLYQNEITINKNTPLRAVAIVEGEIGSDITTSTYFINENVNKLPIVSLVSDPNLLFGDELGLLVAGTNGSEVPSGCSGPDKKANYWNDWDRPCNFEFFDNKKVEQLNQEVKIGNFGACSRTKYIKSIKINAGKVYGDNELDYPIFEEKPNLRWKSIVLRNSGNDFGRSYLRDGFMQTLLIGQVDIDHQAYQPSMVFINGEFYGMLNIRERTNKDFIFSNYGLGEDEIFINEGNGPNERESGYWELETICKAENTDTKDFFGGIDQRMDINEFLNYFMAEIYYGNTDWPGGNIKCWKAKGDGKGNGKWRWILYDTDFGYSLYNDGVRSNNFSTATNHKLFKPLMKNSTIRERFLSKFCVHLATTFSPERCNHILDSLISNITPDVERHIKKINDAKKLEQDFNADIKNMRKFANERPEFVNKAVKTYFKTLNLAIDTVAFHVYSDVKEASYVLNEEPIRVADFKGYFFTNTRCRIKANEPAGYKFSHWEISSSNSSEVKKSYEITYEDTFFTDSIFNEQTGKNVAVTYGKTLKAVYTKGETPTAESQIFFNEICASNSMIVDECREADDWFEIYNNGNSDFNLGGLYLSVNKEHLGTYKIPESDSCIVKAKGYKTFWADNDPEQGVLHTNFKLPVTTSNTLILSSLKMNGKDSVFTIIDSVQYRMHRENESYARFGEYTSLGKEWKITGVPTFGKRNIYAYILDNPTVSVENAVAQIYPNPVVDDLYFSLPWDEEIDAVIITTTGQILKDFKVKNGESVNVSDIKEGIYVLMMQTPIGKIAAKMIKE